MTTTIDLNSEAVHTLKTMRAQLRRKLTPEDLTHTGEEGLAIEEAAS